MSVLEVTPMAFVEIQRRLMRAGFVIDGGSSVIDMNGLTLTPLGDGPHPTGIEIGTLLSQRTKRGMVEMSVNGERTQMDLDKAREILRMLSGAIEAAVSDELIYRFMVDGLGLSNEDASAALLGFRELRQGSRDVVHPS